MNAHNYGPDDFGTYSQDPEWRRLMGEEHPEYELPATETGNDTGTKTGTETRAITGEVTNTGTDSTSTTNSGAVDGSTNENITLTRQGNIGVTTTQKMAIEEINYSDYIKFIDIVALDVVRNFSLGV